MRVGRSSAAAFLAVLGLVALLGFALSWGCVAELGLGPDNLLFQAPAKEGPHPRKLRLVGDAESLGCTEPNAAGSCYRHGTMTGYSLGRCRCEYCRDAYARYRAGRRANGKDDPRSPRSRDTDGHIPIGWFRSAVWRPALKAANLEIRFRIHDMRHAHASWLLAGGADLQVVKERLGHSSLRTTERYLHKLSGIASDGRCMPGLAASRAVPMPSVKRHVRRT